MAKVMKGKGGRGFSVKGGAGHMFGKQHAGPQAPGTAGRTKKGDGGKWAKGGGTKMFGYTGSKSAKPC